MRALAVELQVSVITVKRAYLELERDGIIVTQHGKGSTVARDADLGHAFMASNLRSICARWCGLGPCLGCQKMKSQRD